MSLCRKSTFVIAFTAFLAGGCRRDNTDIYRALQCEDPDKRIAAIEVAAETSDKKALPYLVDRLTDSEAEVRFFAVMALRDITGKSMGYNYYQDVSSRAEAVERWRAWVSKNAAPRTRPAGDSDT